MDCSSRIPALKILVVEDDILIGTDLVVQLEDWGYEAIGPISEVEEALGEIEKSVPDIAILDVNLGDGETSLSIAERLFQEDIPCIFLTGYGPSRIDRSTEFSSVPHLRKPLVSDELHDVLHGIASGSVDRNA